MSALSALTANIASEMQGETAESQPAPPGALLEDVDPSNLREINFDDGKFVTQILEQPISIL